MKEEQELLFNSPVTPNDFVPFGNKRDEKGTFGENN